MLSFLLPDKASLREATTSLTAWGVFLLAIAKGAEAAGFLQPGMTEQAAQVVEMISPLLIVLGLRKAAGNAKVSADAATKAVVQATE